VSATFNLRLVGDVTVIDVAGQIKLGASAVSLRDTLRDLVARNQKNIVVNLREVNYIDSSGIGEFVAGFKNVRGKGGELKLLNLTQRVKDLLRITKLYTVFDVHDDETHAVQSFSPVIAVLSGR
jgi:anti-sigma B factor antagonist